MASLEALQKVDTIPAYQQAMFSSMRKAICLFRQGREDHQSTPRLGDRNMDTAISKIFTLTDEHYRNENTQIKHLTLAFAEDCAIEYQRLNGYAFPESKVPQLAASGKERKQRASLKRKHDDGPDVKMRRLADKKIKV